MQSNKNISGDLNARYEVSNEQKQAFERDGFIKLKNVLSAETLDYYRDHINDLVIKYNKQTVPLAERDTYHKAFLQISNLWRREEEARKLAFAKKTAQIAADLLGVRGVRMYHDQALYKEPSGGFTPWHADQQYWPFATDRCVTVWIPLQETPLEMGPLAFAPGSHKTTFARNLPIGDESERIIEEKVREMGLEQSMTPFEAGEVSYHLGWTLHRAGPNHTDSARSVMTMIYMDVDMKLAEPANEFQKVDRDVFCPGIKPGEIIDTEMSPVLFVR